MTHRALLQQRTAAPTWQQLLSELPTLLDGIVADRPALQDEVAAIRPSVHRIAAYVSTSPVVDGQRVTEGLHRVLSPLFPCQ